jgi:hypothetical protein
MCTCLVSPIARNVCVCVCVCEWGRLRHGACVQTKDGVAYMLQWKVRLDHGVVYPTITLAQHPLPTPTPTHIAISAHTHTHTHAQTGIHVGT